MERPTADAVLERMKRFDTVRGRLGDAGDRTVRED
jgi:putative ABC transport system ATP-binding protein